MEVSGKWVALGVLGLAGLVSGVYLVGLQHGREEVPPAPRAAVASAPAAPVAPPAHPPVGASRGGAGLPAGHPPARDIQAGAAVPPAHPTVAPAGPATAAPEMAPGVRFAHFRVGNRNVKAILAEDSTVWVGTSGGVVRYDVAADDYRLYDTRSGLLSNGVFHLSKLGARVVVGTYGGGLSLLDPAADAWQHYNIQHGLADAFVYDLLLAANGDIWIATWSGANRVRGGRLDDRSQWDTYTVENTAGGLPNDWVYGLAEGPDGVIWLATEGGLARFQDGTWTHWTHKEGLGAPYELVKDQIQFRRDPAKESSHHARQKQEQGLEGVDVAYNPNYIVSLLVDRQGVVWAGTWGGGLGRFDGTSWRYYTAADGLPANHVFMLAEDPAGHLWAGTSHGLARLDGERFSAFTTADGLLAENVFSMDVAPDGSFWVGGFGGVARLQGLMEAPARPAAQ